ncbi:MAG: bifunctional oligoribonuclease/PAP phosphatase NrnA [Bacteroidales bacterium]|nr:bifunctional oligoribonuclease/PAP phosphatase NrnA [Bacteroidales bacterium]
MIFKEIHNIRKVLATAKKIVITSHKNPDGDAVGSTLALFHFLRLLNYEVHAILPNNYPDFLSWLDENDDIQLYDKNREICKELIINADVVFCLDYNALNRVDEMEDPIRQTEGVTIMIDHHPLPAPDFTYTISTTDTSSTAELVYQFIRIFDESIAINKSIAEAIYVGIMTDTGSFSFSCNFEQTYLVVADLIKSGIDVAKIHRLVYDTYSEDRMRLLGYCLSQRLEVINDLSTAYIYLTKDDLKKFNYRMGDTEGVVNYALAIKGINLAILLTERNGYIRLSFRSKGDFSVNELARLHFEGGGHKNAAGGNSYLPMNETINNLLKILKGYKNQLNEADL